MTNPICGVCGRTDHQDVAHYSASGAMKAGRDAERAGDTKTALLWYEASRKLSRKESRVVHAAMHGAYRGR